MHFKIRNFQKAMQKKKQYFTALRFASEKHAKTSFLWPTSTKIGSTDASAVKFIMLFEGTPPHCSGYWDIGKSLEDTANPLRSSRTMFKPTEKR
jgi:hypothetical protein